MSRVEVKGKMSSFGRKISRLSGIYRNARMLIHAFPLFVASYFEISNRGSRK